MGVLANEITAFAGTVTESNAIFSSHTNIVIQAMFYLAGVTMLTVFDVPVPATGFLIAC
jgi:hypothetical protein